MPRRAHLYLGRAGQMAVMAEFLARGWNVAVPEVDIGDDIFVVRDQTGDLFRIQVKTGAAKPKRDGMTVTFSVSHHQLTTPQTPDLTYVFVVRHEQDWLAYLLVARPHLNQEHRAFDVGSLTRQGKVVFNMSISDKTVLCSSRDFSRYLNNWSRWPVIDH